MRGSAIGLALGGILLVWCPCAFALNPALDVSQYAHTAWRIRDGFARGTINVIAQTPDGYLWLGTELGLLRFDGVRATDWRPPQGQRLPSNDIWSLLVTRDGAMWIGTSKGLARWQNGALTHYAQLSGMYVYRLLEDRDGTVWAGSLGVPSGRLCAIRNGKVDCAGADDRLGRGVLGLYQDRSGVLWVGVNGGFWRWTGARPEFHSLPAETDNIQAFVEGDDGALWFTARSGIRKLRGGLVEPAALAGTPSPVHAARLFRDREGGVWIGTGDGGLRHVHKERTDAFTTADGLSGVTVRSIFEDREGTVWVGTTGGLDRFRDIAVPTFTARHGLSGTHVGAILSASDGTVWILTERGLGRWRNGRIVIASTGSVLEDHRGRIWVSTRAALGYLDHDRFVPLSDASRRNPVRAMAEDDGNVWVAVQDTGLFRWSADGVTQQIPWQQLGRTDFASALAADPSRKGLWIGFFSGGVAHLADGRIDASYTVADGLGDGRVNGLRVDSEGTLWAATAGGLSLVKNGRVTTLRQQDGLPCDAIHWTMPDAADSLWLLTSCGLVRISRPQLDAWMAAADRGEDVKRPVQTTMFDVSDGVRGRPDPVGYSPLVVRSSDGRIWFADDDGVSIVDPNHLPFNRLPPPVRVEQVTADRLTYEAASAGDGVMRLPPLTRDLRIDYTALSLVAPEKNRFRIKLEGYDRDWEDVGNRRQAFYNNLPPRQYRFRVMASNNSGVWNEAGAALDFSIASAYHQTTWFRLTAVCAAMALLWAGYRYRLRQVAHAFDARMQSRVDERTRIARELHDTLLQSFHGVMFRFQAAANVLPDRPAEAKQRLETALTHGTQAIREGRDAVQGLRASTVATNDLAVALSSLGNELASAETAGAHTRETTLDVAIHGTPRALRPIVRDDIYRIAAEALRNAFRHARARRIEVEIRYADRHLELRVRDDGRGIDAAVLDAHRAGHFGLSGMRERAELIGGRFEVWSEPGMGTEVALTIPSAAVYASPGARRRFWSLFGRTEAQS